MIKSIQLNVHISSEKSKADLLGVVTELEGIDQVTVDREKGILTVIGTVDPVLLTEQIREAKVHGDSCCCFGGSKKKMFADMISVGPPKKPDPKPPTPPPSVKPCPPTPCNCCPPNYGQCQLVEVVYDSYHGPVCTIL